VHICQTYRSASRSRSVIIVDAQLTTNSTVDPNPIAPSNNRWCIGSYGNGSFWNGLIYRPMWFDRVLSTDEIRAL
jgi:hypothetical protein